MKFEALNNFLMQQDAWYNLRMEDGGPVYAETNPEQFIVEPWNAISSLFMMMPAIIWAIKIYPNYRQYMFLTFLLPLGFLGGLGSTLFHAFREYTFFLVMDIAPSAILTLLLTVYLWLRLLKHWWYILFIVVISVGFRFIIFASEIPEHTAINLSYGFTGLLIGIPLLVIFTRTSFLRIWDVVFSILFFALALLFREVDKYEFLYLDMGTHFLWHLFSAVGSYFVFSYIYYLTDKSTLLPH